MWRGLRGVRRAVSSTGSEGGSAAERALRVKLEEQLGASFVQVTDTSGGCGSFYSILVVSAQFHGLGLLQQHKLVKEVIKQELSEAHGVTVSTRVPPA